jgi:hypothetical protein
MPTLDTVRALAEEIGPRGSTTDTERKAAAYLTERLRGLNLDPQTQSFQSALSAYHPFALATGVTLLSVVLFWQTQPVGAVAALVLAVTVLVSLIQEMRFRPNLLRWMLPIEDSQNVYARIAPRGEAARSVVITAHYDSHRTPLVFSSARWMKVFGLLTPIGVGGIAVLAVLYLIGLFLPIDLRPGTGIGMFTGLAQALRLIALVPGAAVLAVFGLMWQADRSPFSPGANDNASGVGVALALAERAQAEPLERTELIIAFTGCEEVGCYGADALLAALKAERAGRIHFTIDQVGGAGDDPGIVRGERFLVPAASDPGLLAIADAVIAAHPELKAGTRTLAGAYGELSLGVKHGYKSIALGAFSPTGDPGEWHRPTDTVGKVDEAVLARSEELAWLLLRGIDGAPAAG